MSRTVNIFLVATPLQYLASEAIVKNFETGERNYLFYMRENIKPMINPDLWSKADYLPWPKKDPKKGFFGKTRRIQENLKHVAAVCSDAIEIRLHIWVLKSEATNYHINHLKKMYTGAKLSVRIIPDGTINMTSAPVDFGGRVAQLLRKLRRVVTPSLNYYLHVGDKLGCDAPVVDRVYVLHGLPHQYKSQKLVSIKLVKGATDQSNASRKGRALVVSQPLYSRKFLTSKKDLEILTNGIYEYLLSQNINHVDYKSHPMDPNNELFHESYNVINLTEPLERYIENSSYEIMIGITSTSLYLSKLICGEALRVVSYGKDMLEETRRKKIWIGKNRFQNAKRNSEIMDELGIEQIDHYSR